MSEICSCGRRRHATDDYYKFIAESSDDWSWQGTPMTWQLTHAGILRPPSDRLVDHLIPVPSWVHELCWAFGDVPCKMPKLELP